MLTRLVMAAFMVLLVGCTAKPEGKEVLEVLTSQLPEQLRSSLEIDQIQSETAGSGDDLVVKFKARVSNREALFSPVDMVQAAKAAGADLEALNRVEGELKSLAPASKEQLAKEIERATARPLFLRVTTPAKTDVDWYGSFKVKKVVDKWISSQFQADLPLKFEGQPQASFPTDAIKPDAANAWFAEAKRAQLALISRLGDAKRMEQKEAQLAQAQAAAESARAVAEHERQKKEQVLAAVEHQARKLPLNLAVRRSALGKGQVLILESGRPITVRLEVRRGVQSFVRDLQLAPGRKVEIGHLEGWAFVSGDQVQIANPDFDPARFVIN